MQNPTTRRNISTIKSWALADGPVEVVLSVHERTQLTLIAATKRTSRTEPYIRSVVFLNKAQSQKFVHDLGAVLGYEMQPLTKAMLTKTCGQGSSMQPLALYHAHKKQGRRSLAAISISGMYGLNEDYMRSAGGRILADVTPAKALRIFKELAKDLGWELYEKEVAVAA